MQNIISRNILNKNLSLTIYNNIDDAEFLPYKKLIPLINRAKTYLIKEKNCKPGQSVFLADVTWPSYMAWFFACAELGISFIVSEFFVRKENVDIVRKRLHKSYGKIDFFIGNENLGSLLLGSNFSSINQSIPYTYLDDSMADTFYATPNTILLKSTTSGTTGEPKIVELSHEFFYKLMDRNGKIYNLTSQNKCLHTKILHHGSVIGVYFLPTLKYCSRHYWINPSSTSNVIMMSPKTASLLPVTNNLLKNYMVKIIKDESIDKVLLFYDMLDILYDNIDKSFTNDLTVYVLSKIKKEHIEKLIGEYKLEFVSIFGCTESSGPIFLQTINKDNYKTIEENNFGKRLDDFYKLEIENELLKITMPDNSVIISGDKFLEKDDTFFFLGRNNIYKIKGERVYLKYLIDFIEKYLSIEAHTDFDIIVDQQLEKIYLRTLVDIDLDILNNYLVSSLGEQHRIHYVLAEPKDKFMTGIKFDAELFREKCRQNIGE